MNLEELNSNNHVLKVHKINKVEISGAQYSIQVLDLVRWLKRYGEIQEKVPNMRSRNPKIQ